MIYNIKNQSGSVLLYSLLIISLITAISIIISIIVVNEIKLTSGASNGVQAYYAAESGIERGLYGVKIFRNNQQDTLQEVRNAILDYSDSDFENNASYENVQTDILTAKVENILVEENDYIQIDYYDVNKPLNPSIKVVGITVKNSEDDPATWAEVSWTAWDNNGILGTSTEAKKIIGPSDLARDDGWPINNLDVFDDDNETGFDGDNVVGYRVRIKALKAIPTEVGDGNLSSLTVIPYDGTPPPLGVGKEVTDLPTQLVIKSVGERNNFKQSLTATVPWNLPLFGLYDYVLFSEGEILKDIILNAPTYSSGVQEIENNLTPSSSCPWDNATGAYDCQDCNDSQGWLGWCPSGTSTVVCYSDGYVNPPSPDLAGTCKLSTFSGLNGLVLPISDTIVEGDEYYISLRLNYVCTGILSEYSTNRDIGVEISGQRSVVSDMSSVAQLPEGEWITCTIPDTFVLGDPSLPVDDPSRTLTITTDGTWDDEDFINFDWYQLSTYKIFPDCY